MEQGSGEHGIHNITYVAGVKVSHGIIRSLHSSQTMRKFGSPQYSPGHLSYFQHEKGNNVTLLMTIIRRGVRCSLVSRELLADTFNMPTLYQKWVWEREAHINWSMVTCQDSTRLELP